MSAWKLVSAAAIAALLSWLPGCGGGGGIGGTGSPEVGTMHASITDAPSCGFDAVNITVQKIRVHKDAAASDADTGWSEIVLNPAKRVDLLSLTNGVLADLGQTVLPVGKYTQLRLVLAENDSAHPLANSVVPTGNAETALDTPSGTQSGLKINVDIDVAANQVVDVVLDFDACKSVVKRGNSGNYNLKPVLSAIVLPPDAGHRVEGYVHSSIALASTTVSVQTAGAPVKATVPDSNGRFLLYPVPVGTYELVVTSAGHATAVMTGVPVTTTSMTSVNSAAVPIAPPAATPRSVTGTVTPATATVRAQQVLTGGPTIEAAWAPVDANTGAFAFALPIQAPLKTGYVANPASLNFVADSAAAGKYILEAKSDSALKTQAIDVNAPVGPVTFVLP
jgi:hypothetical protein